MGYNHITYKIEDFIGKTINNWTIESFAYINDKHDQYWNCVCKCGLKKPVRASQIIRNISKGCRYCRGQASRGINSPYWKGGEFISGEFYNVFKLGAEYREIEFSISIQDLEEQWIKQDGKCAYTGEKLLLHSTSDTVRKTTASLDRIDSSKGYIKGNIQFTTKHINVAKRELSDKDFVNLCVQVAKYRGGTCGV